MHAGSGAPRGGGGGGGQPRGSKPSVICWFGGMNFITPLMPRARMGRALTTRPVQRAAFEGAGERSSSKGVTERGEGSVVSWDIVFSFSSVACGTLRVLSSSDGPTDESWAWQRGTLFRVTGRSGAGVHISGELVERARPAHGHRVAAIVEGLALDLGRVERHPVYGNSRLPVLLDERDGGEHLDRPLGG